jgi:glycosyltransferase involved in cell wall biosynthesis
VAREGDLDVLVQAYRRVRTVAPATMLVFVGDEPYRRELERALIGLPVISTWFLTGESRSRVCLSTELFIFPSISDTFGIEVLEIQASGLSRLTV